MYKYNIAHIYKYNIVKVEVQYGQYTSTILPMYKYNIACLQV